ncbi:ribonuclease P/MRP protein subunit POP5 [Nylanderia fulva]|uniref:ribonuclease P/MRP protein subunit POP5 n=1 Tax=Nylanderia fulva TaxID=613905 RepID=UPI0010FAE907|nr:ribonuclease P/MRP protein subunit POP5 [Nylanderia fulva]
MVRFKNRYIVLEVIPHSKDDQQLMLKSTALSYAVQQKVQQLYGDFGVAAIKEGFDAKYCNTYTKIALLRIKHGPHKFVLHAVPLINDIGGRFVKTNILYTGATMKHCFLFIRKYQEKKLERVWLTLRTEAERKEMETALMTLTPAMKDIKFSKLSAADIFCDYRQSRERDRRQLSLLVAGRPETCPPPETSFREKASLCPASTFRPPPSVPRYSASAVRDSLLCGSTRIVSEQQLTASTRFRGFRNSYVRARYG